MTKTYTIHDLTLYNQVRLLEGHLSPKVITKSHLSGSKRIYCYTCKYKGCRVYFTHNDITVQLI